MKFRKKPVVIEAFQITKETREDNRDWPEWLNCAWQSGKVKSVFPKSDKDAVIVQTLEGPLVCRYNDWIIKGVKGELYPCKPDIFEQTYERVEE